MSDKRDSFFDVFFLGGIIGAALGVLFAPMAGQEAREKLKNKISEIKDAAPGTAENIKESTQDVVSKTMESIEDGLSRLSDAIEEAKIAAEEKRREVEK